MELVGKTALVTGAGVRLGRAIALGLARQGVQVLVHYHQSQASADEVVAEITSLGGRALALQADLRETASLPALIEAGVQALGAVDFLVNSAAIFERGTIMDTTEESWDRHMATNLKAPFFLSQAYAQRLAPEQRGHIVNIIDWRAERPGVAYMAYTMAKAGLLAMTKSLAVGLGPRVQVNGIAPGLILPPPGDDGTYFFKMASRVPLKRTGAPEDVVRAVLYLLASDFVTGEIMHVTGGEHL